MKLNIIKIGGNVIDSHPLLNQFLTNFFKLDGLKILVHGGGKTATELSKALGIETKILDGRRITDVETLKIAVMVYSGLINKNIVALLQSKGCNAIGLSGADANLLQANRRDITDVDYGFVGDTDSSQLNVKSLKQLLANNLTPVIAPITHDGKGQLLNTNADTVAAVIAIGMSADYDVTLHYCFEKNGVLQNVNDEISVIENITFTSYLQFKNESIVAEGMIPKLDNAFKALNNGVKNVIIGHADNILKIGKELGTTIKLA